MPDSGKQEGPTALDQKVLDEIVDRIRGVCEPDRVILFGSGATGTMTPDSDVDLLVVERRVGDARQEALRIRSALTGIPFPFDVVVMTKERFEETRDVIGGLAWPAARYGKVLYEAA